MNHGTRMLVVLLTLAAVAGCSKKVVRTEGPTAGTAPGGEHVIEHRIVTGETLALIADNYYGDPGRAQQVARDNDLADPDLVTPGSVLRLRFSDDEWAEARAAADLGPLSDTERSALLERVGQHQGKSSEWYKDA